MSDQRLVLQLLDGWNNRIDDEWNGFHAERLFRRGEFGQIGKWLLVDTDDPPPGQPGASGQVSEA